MDTQGSILNRLPPRKPHEILEELAARTQASDNDLFLLTLHLNSGRDVKGYLTGVEEKTSGGSRAVTLRPADHSGFATNDVFYVMMSSIEALTVHGAQKAVSPLSGGSLEVPPGGTPPTRLDLKRRAEEHSRLLAEKLGHALAVSVEWDAFPSSDGAMWALKEQLDALEKAMIRTASDDLGRSELSAKVREVRLSAAGMKSCRIAGGVLSVALAAESGGKGRFSADELEKEIERLL
ncbi:MAG: hypothetical protein RDV48_29315 [Candidatus Eremiobacteraeota bacterium]|nr:hypothetical protein [Candidatus Eremiobacteraeota bacterium]